MAEVVQDSAPSAPSTAPNNKQRPTKKNNKKNENSDSGSAASPLHKLRAIVHELCPAAATASTKVELHLSVGQFDQTKMDQFLQQLQANWTPIEFEVSQICFIKKQGEIFKVGEIVTLNSS